jgi:hypothetical protein
MVVYGYRVDVAHASGTQALEIHHWQLKGPHQGWELWSTRHLDYEFVTLTTDVSFYYQNQLTQQVHGEPPLTLVTAWLDVGVLGDVCVLSQARYATRVTRKQ